MFAPFATGRFCACLPFWEFTGPPAVAAVHPRSNPPSFWIRGASTSAPGAVGQNRPAQGRPGRIRALPRFSPSFSMNRGFVAAVVKRRMVAARWFRQFTLAATGVQRLHALPDFGDWKLSMNLKVGRVTPCAPLMAGGG